MKKIIPAMTWIAGLLAGIFAGSVVHGEMTAPSCCGRQFVLTGDGRLVQTPAAVTVMGADNPEIYRASICGKTFTLSLAGLDAGSYGLQVDLAELDAKHAGERLITLTCGETVLATNLDLFLVAGGSNRAYRFTARVKYLGEARQGPLTIVFTADRGEAVFNAVTLTDAHGQGVASFAAKDVTEITDPAALAIPVVTASPIYGDPQYPVEQRVADLVRRMSLKEKVLQLMDKAPSIPRLGVPGYDYWNECLHGVARNGVATVFPQVIGLAAMWDEPRLHQIADTIATEARAKFAAVGYDRSHERYTGLTFWTPNLNIFRDPRWGRGQETYGEDPFLTAQLGVAFIEGLQGDDPNYLKAAACAKHFAVHSGPESVRREFDVAPPERDLYETYLPQFAAAVREAKVSIVMGAYNRLYGVPCCANTWLLTDLLRQQWGFNGHVVSDCGAVRFIYAYHKAAASETEAAALALKSGCDLNCGGAYARLADAVHRGLCSAADIDRALSRVLLTRFKLGLFDPTNRVPYARISPAENDTPAHAALALQAAEESIVLLKNDGLLPLDKTRLHSVAVIGANADSVPVLHGNYFGQASAPVTFLQGLKHALGDQVTVKTASGCPLVLSPGATNADAGQSDIQAAVAAARGADVVIYVGGISPQLEGEEMKVNYDGFFGGDRTRIELPVIQTKLLQALAATGTPVIFVNCSGGSVAFPWAARHLPAILQAWYPGEAGGTALAKILFGEVNPSGRLPVTFYQSTRDLPPFEDYAMRNRTYRYFSGRPLFPFGHGLSYTHFRYGPLQTSAPPVTPDGRVQVRFELQNTGTRAGDEVVQLYVRALHARVPMPVHSLAAFKRVPLQPGETAPVTLEFPATALRHWDETRKCYVVEPGEFEIQVGASALDLRQRARLKVTG